MMTVPKANSTVGVGMHVLFFFKKKRRKSVNFIGELFCELVHSFLLKEFCSRTPTEQIVPRERINRFGLEIGPYR